MAMEAKVFQSVQPCSWMNSEKMLMMSKPSVFVRVPRWTMERGGANMSLSLQLSNKKSSQRKLRGLKLSSSLKSSQGSVLESGNFPASVDESLVLKYKAVEIEPYLDGRSIYLVGMMGSGKTTIGKLLSQALGYSFFDCDFLVEEIAGRSVAEIFKRKGEGFFRDKETEVLEKVSERHRLVISTGGGAVIRPINWKHMRRGISVWLDVPLECLARRISAVGTGTRPLLHGDEGDAYTKAFARLSALYEERHEAYANADTRISLENLAARQGIKDVDNLTPRDIAIGVFEQIESLLKDSSLQSYFS